MALKKLMFYWCLLLLPIAMFSQIVNKGTFHIKSSTTVYFENEYLNQSTGFHSNNGDLYLNSHFVNNGSTSSSSGTTFFKSSVNDVLNISGTTAEINFYNLEINVNSVSARGVYVEDGHGLLVKQNLNLINGDLRLAGESQLVQEHLGYNTNIVNAGKLLRDQQGVSTVYGYNYWSSPVTNNAGAFSLNGGLFDGTDADINPFSPQQVLFNSGSPYNGVPATQDGSNNVITPLQISKRWLYKYSADSSGYSAWQTITENTSISPGYGFTMKGTGAENQNFVFRGVPNNGKYTFAIQAGESLLIGNPYPSALNVDYLIQANLPIFTEVQFWVDGGSDSHVLADYVGGYAIINLTGGVLPSVSPLIAGLGNMSELIPKPYIGVAQGFFIDAIGTGTIEFNNAQREFITESNENSNFYRNTTENTNDPNKYIRIGYEDPEGFHRQLLLGFLPQAPVSMGLDLGYDAPLNSLREDDLFFILNNDSLQKYVIQAVGSYDQSFEFPLGLIISEVGTHTIMLDDVEGFTDTIYLKDNLLNETYNLSEANVDVSLAPREYLDRFELVFIPQESLGVPASLEGYVQVFYDTNVIVIDNRDLLQLSKASVYSMSGQHILSVKGESLNTKQIQIPFNSPQGVYLVVLNSELGHKTFKIIN